MSLELGNTLYIESQIKIKGDESRKNILLIFLIRTPIKIKSDQ